MRRDQPTKKSLVFSYPQLLQMIHSYPGKSLQALQDAAVIIIEVFGFVRTAELSTFNVRNLFPDEQGRGVWLETSAATKTTAEGTRWCVCLVLLRRPLRKAYFEGFRFQKGLYKNSSTSLLCFNAGDLRRFLIPNTMRGVGGLPHADPSATVLQYVGRLRSHFGGEYTGSLFMTVRGKSSSFDYSAFRDSLSIPVQTPFGTV